MVGPKPEQFALIVLVVADLGVSGPVSTSQSSAGAEPRGAGSGRSRKYGRSTASTSSAVGAAPRRHRCPASSGICSMTRN